MSIMPLSSDICRCVSSNCSRYLQCARAQDIPAFYHRMSFADLLEEGTSGDTCEYFIEHLKNG